MLTCDTPNSLYAGAVVSLKNRGGIRAKIGVADGMMVQEFAGDDGRREMPLEPRGSGAVFYRRAVAPAGEAAFSTFTSASSSSTAKR